MEFRPPKELSFMGSLPDNWRKWRQKFDNYMLAAEKINKPSETKTAILLNLIGDEGVEVYNTFKFDTEKDKIDFSKVLAKFDEYCSVKLNVVFERHKFFKCRRCENQSIDNYVTVLKTLASTCEFESQEENLIRDQVVLNIQETDLQERVLREKKLTLPKVIEYVKIYESSKEQVKEIKGGNSGVVDSFRTSNSQHKQGSSFKSTDKLNSKNAEPYQCKKCGYRHVFGNCPAYGKRCKRCRQLNHFEVGCKSNKVHEVHKDVNSEDSDSSDESFVIDSVESDHSSDEWYSKIQINGRKISFKLDSGASCNVLSKQQLKEIGITKIKKTNVSLEAYGGYKINTIGAVELNCEVPKNKSNYMIKFIIVDGPPEFIRPILGRKACVKLGLIKKIDSVEKSNFINSNIDVFTGTGKIKNYKCHLSVKPDAVPTVKPPRRVPLAIKDRLLSKLNQLEADKIISKVLEPPSWVSNLVIIEKKDKTLRLCLDPKDLNEVILREPALLPSVQEVSAQLTGNSLFTVLDLKDGFYNIELDESSSNLCGFSTPFGVYKFLRLPFGIAVAPEEFQKINMRNFGDIPNVIIYFDDLLIKARTAQEHDRTLEAVIQRARQLNVKFNVSKTQYRINEVKFLGFIFNSEGMKIDPSRVEAINQIKIPTSKKELLRLHGLLNYLRSFIQNFAELTAPLRELMKKDVDWLWTNEHTQLLNKLKILITNAPVLSCFDPNKEITIECDSSKHALGCCLMQNNKPVAYASRTLNETEINYAQIEKELLSLVYATQKFHLYIYGRDVNVKTDHQPLVSLLKKRISQIGSNRLQRMALKLVKYNLDLVHIPGKEMYISDLLSRDCENSSVEDQETGKFLSDTIHMIASNAATLQISESKKQEFITETKKDSILQILSDYYFQGWPSNKHKVPDNVQVYYKLKNDIHVSEGLVFLNQKLIVPQNLQKEMLIKLHTGHLGFSKTKARARKIMYWPQMNAQIENLINSCCHCQTYRPAKVKEPLLPHEIPTLPFEKIGMDLMEFSGKDYLVVVDYLSFWIDVVRLHGKAATDVIKALKPIFSTHGIPQIIIADNMPFDSTIFRDFASQWDIKVITSSPHHAKSNGMSEKAVGAVKSMMKKSVSSKTDFNLMLLEHHNTPVSGLTASPAQILMSRQLRSTLPTTLSNLQPHCVNVRNDKLCQQMITKKFYDRTSKISQQTFKEGDKVLFRRHHEWHPAVILKPHSTPRSYLLKTKDGSVMRRNTVYITPSKLEESPDKEPDFPPPIKDLQNEQQDDSIIIPGSPPSKDTIVPLVSSGHKSPSNSPQKDLTRICHGDVDATPVRRSSRMVKPPQRLNL